MKKLLLPIVFALVLSGCGDDDSPGEGDTHKTELFARQVEVPGKGTIDCIVYSHFNAAEGGVTCDWENPSGGVGDNTDDPEG